MKEKKVNRIVFVLCTIAIIAFVVATIASLIGGNFSTHSPFAGIIMLINGEPFNDALMPLMSLVLFISAIVGFFSTLSAFKKED